MIGFLRSVQGWPRSARIGVALLLTGVIGVADYLGGFEISFAALYLAPVWAAIWLVSARFGAIVAVLSVAISLAGDVAAGARYSSPLVPAWNAAIAIVFYLIVVRLIDGLRRSQVRLESLVEQRTAALTHEIAERARLEEELVEISEREQRRIGRDLHDGLGQHLTAAALAGEVLENKLAARGATEAVDARRVIDIVEEAIELTRGLARGLHPVDLEADGLMTSFADLAANTSKRLNVECRFACPDPVFVHDVTRATHLYRIAQEAITNAVKHGRARRIVIGLTADGEWTTLTVDDDGAGLPPAATPGFGLRNMSHRAQLIGGRFTAAREPAGGTRITCRFPTVGNRHEPESQSSAR
jgi:signal transduction histidine kinase